MPYFTVPPTDTTGPLEVETAAKAWKEWIEEHPLPELIDPALENALRESVRVGFFAGWNRALDLVEAIAGNDGAWGVG